MKKIKDAAVAEDIEAVEKVASMKKQTEAGGWRPSPCLLLCFRDRAINQIQINLIKSYVIRRSKA